MDSHDFTDDEIRKFARELLRDETDPYKTAFSLYPGDTTRALLLVDVHSNTQIVQKTMREMVETSENGELDFIPSKADYLQALWDNANNRYNPPDIREKFFKQFGEATKYLSKETAQINVNTTQNNVMLMPSHGTDDEWEAALQANQAKLIDGDYDVKESA